MFSISVKKTCLFFLQFLYIGNLNLHISSHIRRLQLYQKLTLLTHIIRLLTNYGSENSVPLFCYILLETAHLFL